jgi:hypothetical protein
MMAKVKKKGRIIIFCESLLPYFPGFPVNEFVYGPWYRKFSALIINILGWRG